MSKTVITHPDGSQTVVRKTGFAGGCFTWFVVLFVLAAPAAYFGPWAIAAYVFLAGVMGLAMYGLHLKNAKQKPTQSEPPMPPPMPPPLKGR
jgi:membrane protein implicated in regulation of membrane protease activity